MPTFEDLRGQRFGRLLVLSFAGKIGTKNHWKCQCDCGTLKKIAALKLKSGNTKSCGCLRKEITRQRGKNNFKHGKSHKRIHWAWVSMLQRCYNKSSKDYKHWGGRGIKVCERWHKFENFLADMGEYIPKAYSIERIDNNGDYCKENCIWAPNKQQSRNRRTNVYITYKGRTMIIKDWAIILGINPITLYWRIRHGWNIERAFVVKQARAL